MSQDEMELNPAYTNSWIFLCICSAILGFAVFAHFQQASRGRVAAALLGTVMIAVRSKWQYNNKAWFWIGLVILAVLNTALIWEPHWSNVNYPFIALLPLGISNLAVFHALIHALKYLLAIDEVPRHD